MRKIYKLLLVIIGLFFLGSTQESKASHVMGGDLIFRCIDTLKFELEIKYFRDCRGIPLSGNNIQLRCTDGPSASINLNGGQKKIRDLTPVCATEPSKCDPPNTSNTGEGIEEHSFTITLDFKNDQNLQQFKNCCEITVSYGECCRNGAITTGVSGNFYSETVMDICKAPCNSSPDVTTEPVAFLCCNQPFYYNNGAVDVDGDSVSFEFGCPLGASNNCLSYASPYSKDNPHESYYPPNLPPNRRRPNRRAKPPWGITLDEKTGDLIFTPTKCNEVSVLVITMIEWRKNPETGKMEKIGETRRDLQTIVKTCPGNNPPIIKPDTNFFQVCAGDRLCFIVSTDDPPAVVSENPLVYKYDSVKLDWNGGIKGATFTILNKKARLQSAQFCWSTTRDDARTTPYQFVAKAKDDACPLNALSAKAFQIKVNPVAEAEREYEKLVCGRYSMASKRADNFIGQPQRIWRLLDSNNIEIFDDNVGYFESTESGYAENSSIVKTARDTIQFLRGGKYFIEHTINNLPFNCQSVYIDTIIVPPLLKVDITFGKDTFVCSGEQVVLAPTVENGPAPYTYRWTRPIDFVEGDTADTLAVFPFTPDTSIVLTLTDANGCVEKDTARIFVRPNPTVEIGPDRRICTYDSMQLVANVDTAFWIDPRGALPILVKQGDTLFKEWKREDVVYDEETGDTLSGLHLKGMYTIRVWDSLNCTAYDTMQLYVNDTVKSNAGPDQTLCWNDTLKIEGMGTDTAGPDKSGHYRWFDVSTTPGTPVLISRRPKYQMNIYDTTDFDFEVEITEDTTTCFAHDTLTVNVKPLPELTMPQDREVCCDEVDFDLKSIMPVVPNGGDWECKTLPAVVVNNTFKPSVGCVADSSVNYDITYTFTDPVTQCTNFDSAVIRVKEVPVVVLEDYIFACQDAGEVDLNDYVLSPFDLSSGIPEFACIDCKGYDTDDLIYDAKASNPFEFDFKLKVDPASFDLGSKERDSIFLQFTFINQEGCLSRDSIWAHIVKVPEITFDGFPDLCEDAGKFSLNNLGNVYPKGGLWRARQAFGYDDSARVDIQGRDSLNVVYTSTPRTLPGTYLLEYDLSGLCPIQRDTTITIHPLPTVVANQPIFVKNNQPIRSSNIICETDGNLQLTATPAGTGGKWTARPAKPGLLNGNIFNTAEADTGQWYTLIYTYTNPNTTCVASDSTEVLVKGIPTIQIQEPSVDTCRGLGIMSFDFSATYTNATQMNWGIGTNPGPRGSLTSTTTKNTTLNVEPTNDSSITISIFATTFSTATDVCDPVTDARFVTIHPIPDAEILVDTANGCEPLDVNFQVQLNNNISSGVDTANDINTDYAWIFDSEGNTGTGMPVMYTYEDAGVYEPVVQVTSVHGCDTTLNFEIEVYPTPNPQFVANPSVTTTALPVIKFNNESTTPNILGSEIVEYGWNYGDPLTDEDTSNEVSPTHRYPSDTADYWVTLRAETNHGCWDTIGHPIKINPDVTVYIPNAFTPNEGGPNKNDVFNPYVYGEKSYHMIIFNRWGEVLFETTDKAEGWSGYYKNLPCQQGVYAYTIKVVGFNDREYEYNGTITLIR